MILLEWGKGVYFTQNKSCPLLLSFVLKIQPRATNRKTFLNFSWANIHKIITCNFSKQAKDYSETVTQKCKISPSYISKCILIVILLN